MKFIETPDSTATQTVAYDQSSAQLYVIFKNSPDKVYEYVALPSDYATIQAASSRGSATQKFIKGRAFKIITPEAFNEMIGEDIATTVVPAYLLPLDYQPIMAWV